MLILLDKFTNIISISIKYYSFFDLLLSFKISTPIDIIKHLTYGQCVILMTINIKFTSILLKL